MGFAAAAFAVLALAAAPVVTLAAGGGPVKGKEYKGAVGPGYPMSFKVSANGQAVDDLVVHYDETCSAGAGNSAPAYHYSTLAIKGGKFSGNSTDHFGKTVSDMLHIEGSFTGREAKGDVRDTSKIKSLGTCHQTEPFTATAK